MPCHTSIEHPWFSEHPDRYVWADGRGDGPPNNWLATFGGPAWTRDERSGRWYLHSFYPEQPDLDWRNAAVVEAMQDVVRFWRARGVDGFRIDAIDRLVKDEQLRDDPPAGSPFGLPLPEEYARLEHLHSTDSPDIHHALGALRRAAGDALLVGEVYLPAARTAPYLEHLDAVFAFELFHAPWEEQALRPAIEACNAPDRPAGGAAWVLSNHDFSRMPNRFGAENARAAAVLLLTLPGLAFVYQGEEIGQVDGPASERAYDRAGRDPFRHPMQWEPEPEPERAGFTTGTPWLAPVDASERSVAAQSGEPGSLLELYRALITLRPALGPGLSMLDAAPGVVAYARGDHIVCVNTTAEPRPVPAGETVLESEPGAVFTGSLAPHAAAVLRTD